MCDVRIHVYMRDKLETRVDHVVTGIKKLEAVNVTWSH